MTVEHNEEGAAPAAPPAFVAPAAQPEPAAAQEESDTPGPSLVERLAALEERVGAAPSEGDLGAEGLVAVRAEVAAQLEAIRADVEAHKRAVEGKFGTLARAVGVTL